MATDRRGRLRRWAGAGLLGTVLLGVATVAPAQADPVLTSVDLTGHGYGHGRGLGQWGAYGYAVQGWSYTQIVGQYYGGTTVSTQVNSPITVSLGAQAGRDLLVTSASPFTAGGVSVPAGSAALLQALPDGTYLLSTSPGCGQPLTSSAPVPSGQVLPSVEPGDDLTAMLTICGQGGTRTYRGELSVVWSGSVEQTVNRVRMEDYLRGVVPRESPASWGDAAGGQGIEALKAQAVAARSYAYSERRTSYAQTCDSTACQVYGGAGLNGAAIEDPRSDGAVLGTAGVVLRDSGGAIVRAEFSSSTGGWTAGGAFPAVQDDGDTASPYHNWKQSISAATVASAYGVGDLTGLQVTGRNGLGADGGRVTAMQVVGTLKTVTVTGNDFRSRLGLKSDWFSVAALVAAPPTTAPAPTVVQPTVFEGQLNAPGSPALAVPFGAVGDIPLSCDWDGDGVDTLGVFRNGTWFIGNTVGGATVTTTFGFGQRGDQPVCGDWDGDGKASVGVYRNGMVYLRNSTTTGVADGAFGFGQAGDRLIAGDWNGDGFATVGVRRGNTFYLTDSNIVPRTTAVIPFGDAGDLPTVGDWDGNGTATVGVFRAGVFYLRQTNTPGPADLSVGFGAPGDRPLPGRWAAGGRADVVGVSRSY